MVRMRKVHVHVCHSQCMEFSAKLLLQTCALTKFIVSEAHFHAELIGPSPIVITRKPAKLLKFSHLQAQSDPTVVLLHVHEFHFCCIAGL